MTEKELARCKKYLRSTLLSNKGGIPAAEVFRHYKDLVGEGIPYAKFNYRTLEDFLTSMPDVCQLGWSGRDLMVTGVADRATQHIEKMVSRQQNSKKGGKAKRGSLPPRFGGAGEGREFSLKPPRFGVAGHSYKFNSNLGSVNSKLDPKRVQPRYSPPTTMKKTLTAPPSPRLKIDLKSTVVQVERACLETVGGKVVYGCRVQKLLQGRNNGLFSSQIEKLYQKMYKESLPKDWLEVMERSGMTRVVREPGLSPLVTHALFGERGQASLNNNNMRSNVPLSDNISNHINKPAPPITSDTHITLASARLPEVGVYYDLVVSHIISPSMFYVQSHSTLQRYTALNTEMTRYYDTNTTTTVNSNFTPGSLFAVVESNNMWYRARLVRTLPSSLICLRLIDTGRMVVTVKEKMKPLMEQFQHLPVQAIKAKLASVKPRRDEYGWDEEVTEWFKHVALKGPLVGLVKEKNAEELVLTLYDTSEADVDIVINEEIVKTGLAVSK